MAHDTEDIDFCKSTLQELDIIYILGTSHIHPMSCDIMSVEI
jgi:hypothetical protein